MNISGTFLCYFDESLILTIWSELDDEDDDEVDYVTLFGILILIISLKNGGSNRLRLLIARTDPKIPRLPLIPTIIRAATRRRATSLNWG